MKLNATVSGKPPDKPLLSLAEGLLFLLCSVGCMTIVFGSALWNRTMLAPLDIPAAMYADYHWIDPLQGPTPNNHYTVDIFDHELPRQYRIYRGMQAGEFPWWDPYTDCGRPLVAEAHISGTDALRLGLYQLLPFVPAYNLTKLLHSFLLGLGALVLLRHWGHRWWVALLLALAFEFAGTFALFQTPLAVPAAAVWYPWIWLAWSRFVQHRRPGWIGAGALFCALSFLAGNQQTHVFLVVFAACFIVGNLWCDFTTWKAALGATVLTPLLGGLTTLPILLPQAELYHLCSRTPAFADFSKIKLLTGAASLTGIFPWALGTFRSIDASKVFGETGLGFCLFLGSVAVALAVLGVVGLAARRTPQACVGLLLVLSYLVVCSTPLVAVFYTRLAALAVLGLLALAAEGSRDIVEDTISNRQKQAARLAFLSVLATVICCNLFAFVVFPRVKARVETALLQREEHNHSFPASPELRRDQVKRLPEEISVLNPETVWSLFGVAALLAAVCTKHPGRRPMWLLLALGLNLPPEMSFAGRFTTRVPVEHWQRLLQGGPEQNAVADVLRHGLRLKETSPTRFEALFPRATADYYGVHVTHTYSSFQLPDLETIWNQEPGRGPWQDVIYTNDASAPGGGSLGRPVPMNTPSRFQWQKASGRRVEITAETLNTVTVEVNDGEAGELLRTDRYYPGWRLLSPKLETRVEQDAFLDVRVPPGKQTLVFQYRPRGLTPCLFTGAAALLVCLGCLLAGRRRPAED